MASRRADAVLDVVPASAVTAVFCAVSFCFAPVIVQPAAIAAISSTAMSTGTAVFGCLAMARTRSFSWLPRPDIVVAAERGSMRVRQVMRMSVRP